MAENNENENRDNESSRYSDDSNADAYLFREIIRPPVPGDRLSYKVCMDKPNFQIIDKYFSAIPGLYTYHLPNSVSLFPGDHFDIKIRIQRELLKCKSGYMIPIDIQTGHGGIAYFNNLVGVLKVNASNVIDTELLDSAPPNTIQVNNLLPDMVVFLLTYIATETLIDICSISYSISFDSIKLTTLYSDCCKKYEKCKCSKCRRPSDTIKIHAETIFEITTNLAV